jgi:hypothetical protein
MTQDCKTRWWVRVGGLGFVVEVEHIEELVDTARTMYLKVRGGAPVEPKHPELRLLEMMTEAVEEGEEPSVVEFVRVPEDFVASLDAVNWDFDLFIEGMVPIQFMKDLRNREREERGR